MKKVCTRLLCCIMAFLVLVTLVPIGAYAAQDEQAHDPAGSRSGPATVGASPDDPDSGDPVDSDARFVVELSSKLRSGGSSVMRLKGGGQYDNGSEVTVIAYSKKGFTFVGWFNESDTEYTDCLSNKQSYTFTVTDDLSLIALYDRSAEAVYDVSITGSRFKINEGTTQANSAKFSFNAGEMVYVSFTDESMKFLYWENASRNIVSTSKDFSFLLVSNVKLNAIYTPLETADDSTLVVFRNAYNQILWTHSYSNSYHENIYFPQAPSKMGYTFREWQIADKDGNPTGVKATDSSIRSAMIGNDEVVVVPVYNAVGDNTYNYTVRFIEGSEDLVEPIHGIGTFGDAVNFTAPEIDGKEFLYWRLNDTIVGFDRVYTLLQAVNKDTVLEAVYGESGIDQQSFVGITQVFCSRADDKYVLSHTMQYYIPDDWTMAQAGFLYSYDSSVGSSEDSMVIDNTSVKRHIIGASDNRLIYTFNLKTSYPDRVFYVRGFIKYKDSTGALHTEYTPIKANSYNDINSIRYTVTWLNADGTLLKSDVSVPFGTIPEYDGETPSLAPDDSTLFVFAGWTPEITAVSKDVEYTAVYQETKRTYSGPVWSWNGLSSATASFTADDNSFYVKTVTAQISDTVTEQASCTADGSRTVTATVSFDGRTFTDTKSEAISALGHDFGEWKVTTDPTCTEKGEEIRTCSRCGAKETREVDKLGHEYIAIVTAPTCTEKGYTTHICSHCTDSYVDTYVDALGHDFGEWTVSKASSCTENGIEIRSCSRCDVTETRNVDAIGHDLVHHEAKAATCTEIGWNAYDTCSRCDYTTYVEIPATGHTPAEAVEENKVEATCTTAGSYDSVVYCSVCGAELSRKRITIDALGHDFGEWTVSKASSCTENGIEIRSCSRCDVTETRNVDAIGHDLVHHEAKAATCTEIGWNAYDTCSRCDYTTYVEIPATGHTPAEAVEENRVEATCTTAGSYDAVVYCSVCGAELSREKKTISALGHTPAEAVEENKVEATCTTAGSYDSVVYCSVCGAELSRETITINVLGHDFGEWTVTTAPTCTEKGEETRYCSRCNVIETREVDALGHELVHHEAKEATCTEHGWNDYDTCSRCDYTTYVEIPKLPSAIVSTEEAKTDLPIYRYGEFDEEPVQTLSRLDAVYSFISTEPEADTADYYGNWMADYRVTFSNDVAKESFGLYGAYNGYGHEYSVAFLFPTDVAVDTPVYLLDAAGLGTVTYNDIINNIREFICGVFNLNEANNGTVMTVELVIWKDGNEDDASVIASQSYTFGDIAQVKCIHIWSDWAVTTAPTCTEKGEETRYCSRCDAYETREVDALGHDLVHHEAKSATCTEIGWNAYDTCSRCDYTTYVEIPATGHTPAEAVEENRVEATCTTAGSYDAVVYCSVCGAELSREKKTISALGHTPAEAVEENKVEATCTTAGSYDSIVYCSVCGAELSRETITINVLGHDFGEWTVTTAPTCTEKGEETRYCSRCNVIETREVDALGHELVHHEAKEATCTEHGWNDYDTCSRCDYTTYVEIPKLPSAIVSTEEAKTDLPIYRYGEFDEEPVQTLSRLDAVYSFISTEPEADTADYYGNWMADYRVTFSNDVAKESFGLYGAYNGYGHEYSVAFLFPTDVAVDTPVYLLDAAGLGTVTYNDIINNIREFICGVFNLNEANNGTVMTVELVIWKDGNEYDASVIASQSYTFGDIAQVKCIHIWSDWAVTTTPTCTEKGEETRYCSRCDAYETRDVNALGHDLVHHEAKSATCTEIGWKAYNTCSRCDYTTYVEIPALGHDYTAVVTAPTCTEQGYTTHTCSRCNDSYVDAYVDALGHDFGEWTVTTTPTCTEKGEETRYCSRCDAYETREVDALGHDLVHHEAKSATCTEIGWKAYDTCSRCDYTTYVEIPALGHDYTAVVTAPTCTEQGYTTHTCSRCNDSYVDAYVDALGHDFGEWTVTTTPTCTEKGEETRYCSRCDAYETREVDALGHDLVHHEAKSATCTEIGWKAYDTCSRCDYTTYVEIPALGHEYTAVVTAPTCTEQGYTTHTCSRYNDSYVDAYVDALGHDFGEWTVTTAPTCTEKGEETRYCSRCEAYETRDVNALGHDLVHHEAKSATCTEIGWKAYDTCSRCDYTTYVEIPALGHDYTAVVTAPTCTEQGYTTHTCSRCNDSYVDTYVDALGHDYTAVVTAPTCTEQGYTTHTCSRCNDSYVDTYVDALGHDFGEWTVTTAPTCTEKGEETRYCSRCNVIETREVDALGHDLVHHEAKSATCTEIGWKAYDTCSRCDYTTYVEIPALGHTPGEAVEENRVEATCTTAGSYDSVVYCSVCGAELSRETITINALGHDLVHHEAKSATCTEIGWKAYDTCSRCDYTTYVEIPALGHTPGEAVEENSVEATCTTAGSYDSVVYCSVCGAELSRETITINALGHDLVHHDAKAATCTEIGWKAYDTCSRCDYTSYVEIPALGHTPAEAVEENRVEATCTTAGSYDSVVYCSVCGAELSRETITINALGHRWNTTPIWSWTGTTAATAVFTCEHDSSHTQSVTATVTSAAGTGANLGYTVYTATVSFNDQNYTDTNRTLITYNITYDLDGGSVSSANPASYNVTTATFTLNNPTREGFVFAGWTGTGLSSASDSVTVSEGSTGDRSYTATWTPMVLNTFFHSDNLSRTDTYLYRVGNGNTVSLGTLFKVNGNGIPVANDVKIKVEAVENNSSVKGSGTNLETGSSAKCVYTKNTSDWTQSTLKFTGEGPVKVTISEGTGETYSLNLEIVTGNNNVSGTLNTNASSTVLLGNVSISNTIGLTNKRIFGNGFTIDASSSSISSTGNGIITLYGGCSMDNVVINGPTYNSYDGQYGTSCYAATVFCYQGVNTFTNSRITGAAAPLRIQSETYIYDSVLYAGSFCNIDVRNGTLVTENLTTVGTGKDLGIVFAVNCTASTLLTINGTLTQHNFIAENASMINSSANTLKNAMFGSNYSKYQFTSGNTKYVNAGILSMSSAVGAANIVDNRTDKKNYSGMSVSLLGNNGYVYTMENTDPSVLETSYSEPEYVPSAQIPYEPVFSWSVPSGDNVAAGGDAHCYKDSSGILQIQFLTGGSKTINASDYATFKKYGSSTAITPSSITCVKNSSGANVTVTNGSVTFNDAGEYTISYHYNGVSVYDKDLGNSTTVNYTKTIKVNVAAKKTMPNAVITSSADTGTIVWGGAGTSFDPDYNPCIPFLDGLTIKDYDANGNEYTVLDGSNQASFISSIASVSVSGTTVTITLANGTKLVVKGPSVDGSVQIKAYSNKLYYCDSTADNNPGAFTKTFAKNSYTYTGVNGVAVSYGVARSFTSTTSTSTITKYSSMTTPWTSNKFVMFDAQGGTVSPSYASTSPVTLPTPEREGYAFLNWNTKADGTGTARNAGTSMTFSSTTTLYAIWAKNVTVTFISEGSTVSTISAGSGTSNTLPTASQTTQWLDGWYTDDFGAGTKIGNAGASFTVPASDTTYYAHWSPKYTVSYNANGGTVNTDSAVYEGTALTLPTPTNGAKTFEGWFTASEGGTKIGSAGDSYTPTANIELFAQWSDNILVTFDGNGGTADTNSDTYDRINPIILPSATWSGHQFNGWFTAASGGTKIGDAGASYSPTEAITLHAQWTAYTVSFDGNGATNPGSLSAGSNGSVTLPTPTRTGYTFNGWYTATSGGTNIGNGGASYTPTADITLHAQWTINSYKVTISTNNSSTAVTVNGTTVNNGGSVAYNSVVKVVLSYTQTNSPTFTIKQGNTNVTRYSDEACTSSTTSTAAGTYYFKMPAGDVTINSSSSAGSSCIPSGTMVTMADGSKKAVEDVTVDDRVLVFNHDTGEFEEQGIIFYEADGIDNYRIVNLSFSDGSVTRLIYEHGYFDLDLMKYVYIHENDYTDYIGHRFAKVVQNDDGYGIESVILTDAWVTEENTGCFSFPSVYSLNFVADDFLSMPGGVTGMFNFFDYDENLKYDEAAMAADIETYGLMDYSYFEEYMSYEEFAVYPAKYLNVALGKGLMTPEWLEYLIGRYIIEKR